jgi:hypothetical protein
MRHQKERALILLAASAFLISQCLLNPAVADGAVTAFVDAFSALDSSATSKIMARGLIGLYLVGLIGSLWFAFVALPFADASELRHRQFAEKRLVMSLGVVGVLLLAVGIIMFSKFVWPAVVEATEAAGSSRPAD